jgi:hypothetical protein
MDISKTDLHIASHATEHAQGNRFVGEKVSYNQNGWRVGTIKQLDTERGLRKGMMQITHSLTGDVWLSAHDVNAFGDTVYHGPKAVDVFEERTEEKKAQQAKADKLKEKARRFHR